ncbi:hypothetical protein CBER1_10674 [Cercospora berteroae]|uniref:Lysine-specific metallo-endopeptidase domain-containing protein n=1 Tax=Cercospora berteroae TaxID=357750 RepID=A0A2S6BYQ2_9PEZI|nr:hypothetical protein CBER1_10674 [Cercospora berteroae]
MPSFIRSIRGTILFYFLFSSSSKAYEIHSSRQPEKTLVKEATDEAFTMADLALQELTSSPRDPQVNRLLGLLFAGKDQDPATMDVTRLVSTLEGLCRAAMENEARPDPINQNAQYNVGFDSMRMLEQTILHELTHTLAGGAILDVQVTGARKERDGYGWKSCLALAKNGGTDPDNGSPVTAFDNADSVPNFGLAVRLLRDQPPLYVLEDGGVTDQMP